MLVSYIGNAAFGQGDPEAAGESDQHEGHLQAAIRGVGQRLSLRSADYGAVGVDQIDEIQLDIISSLYS